MRLNDHTFPTQNSYSVMSDLEGASRFARI